MHSMVDCPCCGQEINLEYEQTRFLLWMKQEDYLQNNHYLKIIDELDLPDPKKQEREKQQKLLSELFAINEKLRTEEKSARREKLEMRKEKIHEQLVNNF